jgi:hypothetical protein
MDHKLSLNVRRALGQNKGHGGQEHLCARAKWRNHPVGLGAGRRANIESRGSGSGCPRSNIGDEQAVGAGPELLLIGNLQRWRPWPEVRAEQRTAGSSICAARRVRTRGNADCPRGRVRVRRPFVRPR